MKDSSVKVPSEDSGISLSLNEPLDHFSATEISLKMNGHFEKEASINDTTNSVNGTFINGSVNGTSRDNNDSVTGASSSDVADVQSGKSSCKSGVGVGETNGATTSTKKSSVKRVNLSKSLVNNEIVTSKNVRAKKSDGKTTDNSTERRQKSSSKNAQQNLENCKVIGDKKVKEKVKMYSSIEQKNKALNSATRELEAKVKHLQARTKNRPFPAGSKIRATSAPPDKPRNHLNLPPTPVNGVAANMSSRRSVRPSAPSSVAASRRGSLSIPASNVSSRLREREAEFAKQVQDRDEQITRLKERLKILSKKLSETKENFGSKPQANNSQNQNEYAVENGAELQYIIRQVTKERLQLERHLQIANDSLQRNNGVDLQRYLNLETTNNHLRQQLESLDTLQKEHKEVEVMFKEKDEACRELANSLRYKSVQCQDLESQLQELMDRNSRLAEANNDLQRRVVELEDVSEECQNLRSTLQLVETEYSSAKSEVRDLSGKVRNLESVLREMQMASESRKDIERQHREAVENLRRREEEMGSLRQDEELISNLKNKISDLEKEKNVQNEKHQELILEMAELKRYGGITGGTTNGTGTSGSHPNSEQDAEEIPEENLEIDAIMAKLEQDNKFLEDLEKQRADNRRFGKKNSSESPEMTGRDTGHIIQANLKRANDSGFISQSSLNGSSSHSPPARNQGNSPKSTLSSKSTPGAKKEDKSSDVNSASSSAKDNSNLSRLPNFSSADRVNMLDHGHHRLLDHQPNKGIIVNKDSDDEESMEEGSSRPFVDKDGSIEIPGKGWCFVYVARYSYDPFQHSPNESPEAELQLNAGDYVLVWGDLDEDGFFDGELLDGRRGLVPSNFVEKLEEEDDLVEFHQQVILGLGGCDDSVCTSIPQDLDFLSSDELDKTENAGKASKKSTEVKINSSMESLASRKVSLPRYASCTDLEMTEDEGDTTDGGGSGGDQRDERRIHPPKLLTIEGQHDKSLVVGWSPSDTQPSSINGYQVILDGVVHSEIPATAGTAKGQKMNSVIAFVDASKIHRISVKTVAKSNKNKTSNEAACTMVFGKDSPLCPTNLKATRTTSTSCTIGWVPSNSNFMHSISVNNFEVKTVKPGVFKHTLAGLQPGTRYKVTVRTKNLKAAGYISGHNLANLAAMIDILTLPRGLPDPPECVRVDKGPKEGTISVTWFPVTINPSGGTSNGAPVTGYVVYGDERPIKTVDDGTADSALIDIGRLPITSVSVRTKSNQVLSKHSDPCPVPKDVLPKAEEEPTIVESFGFEDNQDFRQIGNPNQNQESKIGFSPAAMQSQNFQQNQHFQNNGNMNRPPREMLINYASGYPELDSDIGPSELSDIAEEPEEGLSSDSESKYDDEDSETKKSSVVEIVQQSDQQKTSASSSTSVTSIINSSQSSTTTINVSASTSKMMATLSTATATTASTHTKPTHSSTVILNGGQSSFSNGGQSYVKQQEQHVVPPPQQIRIFVALFDYDPATMSPNPETCHEELPFREGQLIKIIGDKDEDGFYWGETPSTGSSAEATNSGFVPCNMVSEVQVDDDNAAGDLFNQQQQKQQKTRVQTSNHVTSTHVSSNHVSSNHVGGYNGAISKKYSNNKQQQQQRQQQMQKELSHWDDPVYATPPRRKLALYDYDPKELSPNVDAEEAELCFRTGEVIYVYGEMDDDGFYMGELAANGDRGLVPSNFLADVPPGYDPKHFGLGGGGKQNGYSKRW